MLTISKSLRLTVLLLAALVLGAALSPNSATATEPSFFRDSPEYRQLVALSESSAEQRTEPIGAEQRQEAYQQLSSSYQQLLLAFDTKRQKRVARIWRDFPESQSLIEKRGQADLFFAVRRAWPADWSVGRIAEAKRHLRQRNALRTLRRKESNWSKFYNRTQVVGSAQAGAIASSQQLFWAAIDNISARPEAPGGEDLSSAVTWHPLLSGGIDGAELFSNPDYQQLWSFVAQQGQSQRLALSATELQQKERELQELFTRALISQALVREKEYQPYERQSREQIKRLVKRLRLALAKINFKLAESEQLSSERRASLRRQKELLYFSYMVKKSIVEERLATRFVWALLANETIEKNLDELRERGRNYLQLRSEVLIANKR